LLNCCRRDQRIYYIRSLKKCHFLSDDSKYSYGCERNAPEIRGKKTRRDKKKKCPPIIITIIVSRKISAILLTRTRTHKRAVGLLNPSRCKRSLAKHRGNALPSRIHPRELLKICWLRFIYSSNNNNVTRRVRVRVQLLYIYK